MQKARRLPFGKARLLAFRENPQLKRPERVFSFVVLV
jgi:hypothetical protein